MEEKSGCPRVRFSIKAIILTWPRGQGQRFVDEVNVQLHGGEDTNDMFNYQTVYD